MFVTFRKSVLSIFVTICLVIPAIHLSASETEKDLADSFCSLEFINARARQNRNYVLVNQLFHKTKLGKLPDGRPKQGTYSDETVKRILDGFHLIQADFSSPTRSLLISDQEVIHQAFIREFNTRMQKKTNGISP